MQRDKETVYDDGNIKIEIEVLDGVPFLHAYVEQYNKTVLKELRGVHEELERAFLYYGWEEVYLYTQNPKFAKLFPGFEKIDDLVFEGETYEVMVWDLIR